MQKELINMIETQFAEADRENVIAALSSITVDDVMARSEDNLFNTRRAVLQLSQGDREQIKYYVDCAKQDFRDVIYWASEETNS